ncbi:MAG: carbamoyltransferase N-terminal domain-containing protein [Chitinophagales bacterium]|nr:carbamoyltransferase N-terminal domain-containing protein [Chitinophagales bacterium]
MRQDFKTFRFDSISADVQSFHENIVKDFIRNWIRKTGVRKIAVVGCCFMNIKANKLLMEMDECDDLFEMPGYGDESCALGASVISHIEHASEKNPIQKLEHLYLGTRK